MPTASGSAARPLISSRSWGMPICARATGRAAPWAGAASAMCNPTPRIARSRILKRGAALAFWLRRMSTACTRPPAAVTCWTCTAGWTKCAASAATGADRALARRAAAGGIGRVVTQKVDGLHQAAGSRNVLDLHGRLDGVRCMRCDWRGPRAAWQAELEGRNPAWAEVDAADAPDGDADLE